MTDKLSILSEELKDINKNPYNIHYTSSNSLLNILKHGYLKGKSYVSFFNNKAEIATLRRSEDKKLRKLRDSDPDEFRNTMERLSPNIDDVKIYLFTDRIRNAVRGAKKFPISEYNLADLKYLNILMEKIYNGIFFSDDPTANFKEIKKDILELIKDKDEKEEEQFNKINKLLSKKYKVNKSSLNVKKDVIYNIIRINKNITNQKGRREAEERFSFDRKYEGIPAKPEFMKIRFINPYRMNKKYYIELLPFIKNNKKLFVQDKALEKVKKIAEGIE